MTILCLDSPLNLSILWHWLLATVSLANIEFLTLQTLTWKHEFAERATKMDEKRFSSPPPFFFNDLRLTNKRNNPLCLLFSHALLKKFVAPKLSFILNSKWFGAFKPQFSSQQRWKSINKERERPPVIFWYASIKSIAITFFKQWRKTYRPETQNGKRLFFFSFLL